MVSAGRYGKCGRLCRAMIYPYDNANQTRWTRGDFNVQLVLQNNPRPIGFCDGSAHDEQELRSIAETEGADFALAKKRLKSGREIWTLGGPNQNDDLED